MSKVYRIFVTECASQCEFWLDVFGLCQIILGQIDKRKCGKGFKRRPILHINAKLWVKMLILDLLHPFITFCFLKLHQS
jgi:hypothetical protein